ncbi:hypothetical protein FACS1894110_17190 [Spirochaetia bacterium]|nr:hypothetical protein FACS1894110_17190 [Spirochaetia bacterium]
MDVLLNYVNNCLRPTPDLLYPIPSKINKITNVLRSNSSLSLKEVLPGGSYEKGTMLRHHPDIDVVLVFNKEPGIKKDWKKLMHKVFIDLKTAFPEADIKEGDFIAIQMQFKGDKANYDIIPSYKVNSVSQMSDKHTSPIYQGIAQHFHVEYVKQRKNLRFYPETVMLLKDWKNEHGVPLASFHMELIATSVYEYRLEDNFSLEESVFACFQEIQGLIDGTPVFPVNWADFDPDSLDRHYDYPLLIDPANPSINLLEELKPEQWKKIKSEASRAMALISNGDYGAVFDTKDQTHFFRMSS